ncbi:MAG TPA: N-acetylmuramoyl-L-alanine amidase [Candidatus Caccenecus avistercoris]|nr:N-acetylmuramoyl-L-alanine amidase [Candidatus Caccenecus avistercoris]
MKTKFKIVILILLLLSALFINTKVNALMPLSGKIIVIDPGHGGKDPGTISDTTYESNINLAISKALEIELSKAGATVILTRNDDYDLSVPNARWRKKSDFDNRINLINDSKADIYLSIHLNYLTNSAYYGPQVFYDNKDTENLATIIQNTLNTNLNTDRKIKPIPSKTYMYDKLNVPGVLIECGFLSNPSEKSKLITEEYQQKLAILIKDALISYFN